jgi:3-dehydroquinate dehydratase-2
MKPIPGPASGGHVAASGARNRNRVAVMHGVNLDQLGRRPAGHYGTLTLMQLEARIAGFADQLGLSAQFFQTNHEGQFVEELHRLEDTVDGLLLNPGAWTHYSYAIRDALEIAGLPAVEVHLSDVDAREDWRRQSVIRDLCVATVSGRGPDGYREALVSLRDALGTTAA